METFRFCMFGVKYVHNNTLWYHWGHPKLWDIYIILSCLCFPPLPNASMLKETAKQLN